MSLTGEIDMITIAYFDATLDHLADGPEPVIIDFRQVSFCSVDAAHSLMGFAASRRGTRTPWKVVVDPALGRLLALVDHDQLLPTAATLTEALQWFATSAARPPIVPVSDTRC